MRTKDRYARLAGRFWRHPKAVACSDGALALWTRSLSYVVDQMTDGHVSRAVAKTLTRCKVDRLAAELVELELWNVHPQDGWTFHDYEHHNITRDGWQRESERNRNKTNASRARDREHAAAVTAPVTGNTKSPVTGNSQTQDAGRRTQDVEEGGDPPNASDRDALAACWASSFRTARGAEPSRDEASLRELLRLTLANGPTIGCHPLELGKAIIAAYWLDPWTREHRNRASLRNLLTQHDALLASVVKPMTHKRSEPFDPMKHTPATADEEREQRAWIAAGCPTRRSA